MIPGSNIKSRESKPRKKPKTEFERQVSRLDSLFSEYIRLSAMDINGMCRCVTCGKLKTWNQRKSAAGHFIGKHKQKNYRTRWHPKNVHVQCYNCNSNLEGNKWEYGKFLNATFGEGTTEYLERKSKQAFNPIIFDMPGKIKFYREKVKELKILKGVK